MSNIDNNSLCNDEWPWIILSQSQNDHPSNLTQISPNEFVKIPWNITATTHNHNYLLKYNTISNEWTESIRFPDGFRSSYHTSSYDSNKQLLYVIGSNKALVIFDFIALSSTMYANAHPRELYYPVSMIINGEFHVVVGEGSNQHFKWNPNTLKFEAIFTFTDFNHNGMMRSSLIYVESKQMALLIGGKKCGPYRKLDTIYCYSVKNETMETCTWTLLPLRLPHKICNIGHVLTFDEKYILLFGGTTDDGHSGHDVKSYPIYRLNLDDWSVIQSKVLCPTNKRFDCIVMSEHQVYDEVLINGYLRYNGLPFISKDLIHLLIKWISTDYVHLICGEGHWKIDIAEIFK